MSEESKEPKKPDTEEKSGTDRGSPGTDRDLSSSENTSDDSSRSPGTDRKLSSSENTSDDSPGTDRNPSSS